MNAPEIIMQMDVRALRNVRDTRLSCVRSIINLPINCMQCVQNIPLSVHVNYTNDAVTNDTHQAHRTLGINTLWPTLLF